MLCTNLFTETCNLVEEDGTNQLVCNIIRKSELQMATGEGLRRCARVLARKATTMNHEQFAAAQQAFGYDSSGRDHFACYGTRPDSGSC